MLTEEEKALTRYHLGYPQIGNNTVLALGYPTGGQMQFLLEAMMDQMRPSGEPIFRKVLQQCICVEAQMIEARSRLKAEAVGTISLRGAAEIEDLEDQYMYWTNALSDIFSGDKNPYSNKFRGLSQDYILREPI